MYKDDLMESSNHNGLPLPFSDRLVWLLHPFLPAHPHVLHPRGQLRLEPPARAGGRAGRLLPDRPAAAHLGGALWQHVQHRLFQLRRHERHQGDQRHHAHGAGQPADGGDLGGEPGVGLGVVPRPADPGLPGAAAGDLTLQRPPSPSAGPDAVLRAPCRRRGGGKR